MNSKDIMKEREQEIGKIVEYISSKTGEFTQPKLVLIGGYALRRYLSFSRYSRDCDFVLKEGLNRIRKHIPRDMTEQEFMKGKGFGFMRWLKMIKIGSKTVKAGIDFMENQVRGREGEYFVIDKGFLDNAERIELVIGRSCRVFVPSYEDIFLLKTISARSSDIRDIAAMVWENGIPEGLMKRAREVTPQGLLKRKLEKIILPEISDRLFTNSFRGTFITEKFGDAERLCVLKALEDFLDNQQ